MYAYLYLFYNNEIAHEAYFSIIFPKNILLVWEKAVNLQTILSFNIFIHMASLSFFLSKHAKSDNFDT